MAVVVVGSKKDSESYIRSKQKEAAQCGIEVLVKRFDGDISELHLLKHIGELNVDRNIDGIVVQLPLPSHINSQTICQVEGERDINDVSFYSSNFNLYFKVR